jgi:hypothetical protein
MCVNQALGTQAAGPPVKRSAENRAFLRLAWICRQHFSRFAGNPNRQPEIQKNRWKFLRVREVSNLQLNFSIFS